MTMTMTTTQQSLPSSAKGVLSLLRESDNAIILFALRRLNDLMDTFWCEISADLPIIEELHESLTLSEETRKLAALIASEVFFHLGAYDESVHYALAAGSAFDSIPRCLFTDTILSRCIDQYVQMQETPESLRGETDPRLEQLFLSLAKTWTVDEDRLDEVKEIVGFIIRARRLDFLERVLRQYLNKSHNSDILTFTFRVANVLLRDIGFRRGVLTLLASLYRSGLTEIDYFSLTQCLVFLNDVDATASLIMSLLSAGNRMVAYQLAFDIFEEGNQNFLASLLTELERRGLVGLPLPEANSAEAQNSQSPLLQTSTESNSMVPAITSSNTNNAEEESATAATTAPSSTITTTTTNTIANTQVANQETVQAGAKLLSVLSGEVTTNLYLKFLYVRCAADIHICNQIKRQIDSKRSVVHNATVVANALMYCGTSIDGFLRDNMAWMAKAKFWSQFTAIASIGVIHRGHVAEAMKVMQPYLPAGGNTSNNNGSSYNSSSEPSRPYYEAGALYALGLIHAPLGISRDNTLLDYLSSNLYKYATVSQMIHGASLGIGLAAIGLQSDDLCDVLFTCVGGGDAIGGEAAAVGIGLVMMGSGNATVINNFANIATEDNQKEKIIRGTSMALGLISLGRENEALELANKLLDSADPWIRLGGCFTLGLAFAGTENNVAIERLLYVAVKDTSDDVRRNAVTMIGFLTFKDPSLCLELVHVLVDSHNPHIRYGVALALAVSAAGTGRSDIIDVLWGMKDDLVNYVRQGVYMALAIVMVQLTEKENGKVKEFSEMILKKIGDRKEDICSKFGCILAAGLLDAGGRNCTFSLHRDRHRLDKAVVGMFMFTQYWYWYPYLLMISLAMQPTCFIGLNDELQMLEYTFKSNAPPNMYAIPKSILQEKKEIKATGVQAVVLSTTKKEEELRQRRHRSSTTVTDENTKSTNALPSSAAGAGTGDGVQGVDGRKAANEAANKDDVNKKAEESEVKYEILHNPARVTAHQFSVLSHDVDSRYKPLKPNPVGVCLLVDTKPELGEQKHVAAIVIDDEMAPMPEPFTYPEENSTKKDEDNVITTKI